MPLHRHAMAQPPAVATADQKVSEDDDYSTEIMLLGQFGVRPQEISTTPRQSRSSGRSLETSRASLGAGAIYHRVDARENETRNTGGVTQVPGRIIATLQRKFWDSNKVLVYNSNDRIQLDESSSLSTGLLGFRVLFRSQIPFS